MTKKAVVNVRSMDNACFAWSVVAALYPAKSNVERESSYPQYKSVLNLNDIEFPMTLSQIKIFENLNAISINVYTIENKEQVSILPIRLADTKKEKHVNLLYVEKDDVGHFTWIKNLSHLVSSQLSKKKNKKYICDRCLHYFSSSEKLEVHTVDCREMNKCAIRLPSEDDKWLSFSNYSRKERVPFDVYADLECILTKIVRHPEPPSYKYQHHQVFSIDYYVHCSYNDALSTYQFRRDTDCVAWFADKLRCLAQNFPLVGFVSLFPGIAPAIPLLTPMLHRGWGVTWEGLGFGGC
ncbi:PREDICTED: uncharacterized protein LOC105456731 [Wasmannia auropunctata]|uniref:uncharacterized protein LOC105456731 n=1 Tax=Wasmannia auropunctata TaxID=64793 RepID=UPI0005EF0602|nr:PREDICTED: uncharacterized protein LOC105456731 [Wasmannia auropunctata]